MSRYPGQLDQAVAARLDQPQRELVDRSAALTAAYRQGETSGKIDLAAYLAARLPATFAANQRVLQALTAVAPDLAPRSVLDVGAGPGTASWAALAQWPDVQAVCQVEQDSRFSALLRGLNAESGLAALKMARIVEAPLQGAIDNPADLVLASYVLAELPLSEVEATLAALWQQTRQALVLLEPGTPHGFARIRSARQVLIEKGATLAAPCTHAAQCPLAGDDWCHFKIRLARSRQHMRAKAAYVPYEDEAFSYLVALRVPRRIKGRRIIAQPAINKAGASFTTCSAEGLSTLHVPSRDRLTFRRARRARWGDLI